jgi:hypothetical protein
VKDMVEVTVKLQLKGKNYLTNVIVKNDTPEEQILRIAQEQIEKQWLI